MEARSGQTLSQRHPGLMMPVRVIRLTHGRHAIVDPEDYATVAPYGWQVITPCGNLYLTAWVPGQQGRQVTMPALVTGSSVTQYVSGDHLDNRRSNLRASTWSRVNASNGPRRGSSSRFKGVTRLRTAGKWKAQIMKDGKNYGLGQHDTEEQAARAYDRKAIELYGPDAVTNKSLGLY